MSIIRDSGVTDGGMGVLREKDKGGAVPSKELDDDGVTVYRDMHTGAVRRLMIPATEKTEVVCYEPLTEAQLDATYTPERLAELDQIADHLAL